MKEKIALPIDKESVSAHFGHAEQFVLYDVEDNKIVNTKKETPPPHEPGSIPRWLHALGATTVITGGMGQKAISLFQESGIQVLSAPAGSAHAQVINDYLAGKLGTPAGGCKGHSHSHQGCH